MRAFFFPAVNNLIFSGAPQLQGKSNSQTDCMFCYNKQEMEQTQYHNISAAKNSDYVLILGFLSIKIT